MWLLLATTDGHSRNDFWKKPTSTKDIRFEGTPFRLNDIITRARFNEILKVHTTQIDPFPTYHDPFHPVRNYLKAWNDNMEKNFLPSWVTCLDESISLWTNMFTCPGFVFCPCKPWETGNKYHTIGCGMTSIIFWFELMEGKDRPKEKDEPKFNNKGGKTVGLLLRMTKSIWNTGRLVILDSGFCVLIALIELSKVGLFASALIKKRRYWPKFVCGEEIKQKFKKKDVGNSDAWPGMMDGHPFYIFSTKEPEYIVNFMSTYGTLNVMDNTPKNEFTKTMME